MNLKPKVDEAMALAELNAVKEKVIEPISPFDEMEAKMRAWHNRSKHPVTKVSYNSLNDNDHSRTNSLFHLNEHSKNDAPSIDERELHRIELRDTPLIEPP